MVHVSLEGNPAKTDLMLHPYGHYQPLNSSEEQSRSQQQLYRYNHEPVTSNLLRRDIPPILILLFFLFLIVITLSQILVVHTSRYGANFSTMQKIQEELKQMDESMEVLLRDHVLPIDKWRLLFHIQTYLYRFEDLFESFHNISDERTTNRNVTDGNDDADDRDLKQWLKPLLNKSKELLTKKNHSVYLVKNLERVQTRLKAIVNSDGEGKKSQFKRNYCQEQPKHLRTFERGIDRLLMDWFLFLEGRFLTENSTFPNISLYEIETNYSMVRSGGQWSPTHCRARHRVRNNSHQKIETNLRSSVLSISSPIRKC